MSKVISIANQKGGVGKTTLTANLGAGLAQAGKKVLLIDFDSQGNLSNYLGYEKDNLPTINNLLIKIVGGAYIHYEKENEYTQEECDMMSQLHTEFHKAVRHNKHDRVDYIPADITLAGADIYLVGAICREKILDIALSYFKDEYEYILIDCPPSLGMFLSNALTSADELIIPVQAENWAVDGLAQIINSFKQIKRNLNPKLKLNGLVLNMTNDTKICKEIQNVLSEQFGELLYKTQIRRSVKATESTALQQSLVNDSKNKLGEMYINFTREFLSKEED